MEIYILMLRRFNYWMLLATAVFLMGMSLPCAFAHDLQVQVVNSGSTIDFGDVRSLDSQGNPVGDTSRRQVRLTITNQNATPYVVSQTMHRDPENQHSHGLDPGAITFRMEQESGTGTVRTGDGEALDTIQREIYLSDDAGSDATLLLTYDFQVPPGQKAGAYHSSISYRVDEKITG